MSKPLALPADLMRRYRRCIRFDYWLCALYVLSAAIPAWALFRIDGARLFHAAGVLILVSVGIAGIMINQRLLDHRITRETPACWVTIVFVLSRLGLVAWGMIVSMESILRQVSPTPEATTPWTEWATLLLKTFVSPPFVYLLFFAAIYRTIYHISVHFYLRGMASIVRP
jgi:hypothetical protein